MRKDNINTLEEWSQWRFKISEFDEWLRSGNTAETDETDANELNGGL